MRAPGPGVLSSLLPVLVLRSFKNPKSAMATVSKRLWLIRHGQSTFNKKIDEFFEQHPEESGNAKSEVWWESPTHYDPCVRDAPLTELGVSQACDLPRILGKRRSGGLRALPFQRSARSERVAIVERACETFLLTLNRN